jgi:DNA-binding transcriptional ArsR family regulator
MLQTREATDIEAVFSALANETRRAILTRLVRGEAKATELARPFDMTQPAISHHLRVLEEAGLITRRIDGTKRPCRLSPNGLEAVDRWLDLLRDALSANYDRLDALLSGPHPPVEEHGP